MLIKIEILFKCAKANQSSMFSVYIISLEAKLGVGNYNYFK